MQRINSDLKVMQAISNAILVASFHVWEVDDFNNIVIN